MFKPLRNRDAYAAIRGYVYQIDRTVDHWLSLKSDEVLELERGEDIDVVGKLVRNDGETIDEVRLLEQVKHREDRITLRTPASLEALANFCCHRHAASEGDLRFRFLTNAVPGPERFSPFPARTPGITYWENARTRRLSGTALSDAASRLRLFLAQSQRPDSLNLAVWTEWKAFVDRVSTEEFLAFIDRFEWSTGFRDGSALPRANQARINALGLASDESNIRVVADRLFVHVTRLLATSGLKRLTPGGLAESLADLPATSGEVARIAILRELLITHSDRLDQLEADVSTLGGRFEALVLSNASCERIELTLSKPDLSLPQPVARLSHRAQTAAVIRKRIDDCGWLALRGGPDTGKSQLSLQVAISHGLCLGWIRFHHMSPEPDAVRHLDSALTALGGQAVSFANDERTESPASVMSPGKLLVLDDIPRMTGSGVFADRLVRLGHVAQKTEVKIISTSQFEIPVRIRSQFPDGWIREYSAPPFTDEEAGELLRAHGAPGEFLTDSRLRFLNGLAVGHPLLLAAVAEFLAPRCWKCSDDEINALLRGDHTETILPEVVERLTRTLRDQPRELLYRLTLPFGGFTYTEVSVVSAVSPAIVRPREQLNQLLGAWVQRDTATRFVVSPLVRTLGRSEITDEVRIQCFRSLADEITARRQMDAVQCDLAIHYNLNAYEHARAVTLYVILLAELLKSKASVEFAPLIDRWREEALPADLSVGNRLLVRAYQIALFPQCNLDIRFVVEDIDTLLAQATVADGWAIVGLAVRSLASFRLRDPERVLRYVRAAVELPIILGPDGEEMELEMVSIKNLLWMLVTDLRNPAMIRHWLDAVTSLPEKDQQSFWSSQLAEQGIWLVGNRTYMTEFEKPANQQDWASLVRDLRELRSHAMGIGQPRLEASLTGVILEILGDRKWLDQAPAIAQETLLRWPADPDVQFEVRGTWGRQYAYQKRYDLANPLLDYALSQPHAPHDHERLRCLLAASLCVGSHDLNYARQARDLARASDLVSDIEAARALGEYAISVHQDRSGKEGAIEACTEWSEALRRFYDARSKNAIWRDLFPLFAHVTSYLRGMAHDGTPPDSASDGGAFVVPGRGFLMKDYMPEREALYRAGAMAAVAWIMQSYASSSGVIDEADYWMRYSIEESRRVGASFIQAAVGTDAAAMLLSRGNFEDAIEIGVFAGRGSVVHRVVSMKRDGNFEGIGVDVSAAFRAIPDDYRRLGDRFAVISGLLPAAMAIIQVTRIDPAAATSALNRAAKICHELAADEPGDSELWEIAGHLLEASSSRHLALGTIKTILEAMNGNGEREITLRVLGHVLATAHASPEEAIGIQLGMINILHQWYPPTSAANRFVVLPYIEAYWRSAIQESQFAFRSPSVTIPTIQSALEARTEERIFAILSAVSSGFWIPGASEVLQTLRQRVGTS